MVRNLVVHYPEQTLSEVTPYPWSVRADGELCQVLDLTLTKPYQAIDVGSKWNELHLVRNVFACPLKIGVYIDQCTDIARIENVHFNPDFWTRMALKPGFHGGDIKAWLENNLVGFKIGKTDWEFISNSFVIFPKIGFHFDDFGHGPGNAVITQSGSDICPVAVRVDRTQPHAGVQFANAQFMSTVEVGPHNQGPPGWQKKLPCGSAWPLPRGSDARVFDWDVVFRQYIELWQGLLASRDAGEPDTLHKAAAPSSALRFLADFSSYATAALEPGDRFRTTPAGKTRFRVVRRSSSISRPPSSSIVASWQRYSNAARTPDPSASSSRC